MALRAPVRESPVTRGVLASSGLSSTTRGVPRSVVSARARPTHSCGAIAITPSAPSADSRFTASTTVARSAVSRAMELTR